MGTRGYGSPVVSPRWDHPHAYGDKFDLLMLSIRFSGSSPRVWGQGIPLINGSCSFRIIPTRMGTSANLGYIYGLLKDHPHAYGDKLFNTDRQTAKLGSSPRVWGQVVCLTLFLYGLRIIPTRMGTRVKNKLKTTADTDHPHAYGDKSIPFQNFVQIEGSSPRVWGQGSFYSCWHSVRGIIPTRMGTSNVKCAVTQLYRDHPHAYGDKKLRRVYKTPLTGSSPRVWGQVRNSVLIFTISRIIPTRMGTRIKFKEMDFNI